MGFPAETLDEFVSLGEIAGHLRPLLDRLLQEFGDPFGPGWQAAASLGIIPRLRSLGYRIQRLDYVDRSGKARATLSFAGFAEVVGGELTSILRPDLELAIHEKLPPGGDLRYGRTVSAVGQSRDGVTVALDDGQMLAADLLIGADGIHSAVREVVLGPEEAAGTGTVRA